MLLFRAKIPAGWVEMVQKNIPAILIDHAHLERKAATTALNLEKYHDLFPRVDDLDQNGGDCARHGRRLPASLEIDHG